MSPTNGAHLLKFSQVAERLNCSDSTVRRLVKSGVLPTVCIGPTKSSSGQRFRPEDIERYIESRTSGGGGQAA
jgi:excisionase family DNA binding protein